MSAEWIVDVPQYEGFKPQDVTLRTPSWRETIDIDRDGDLCVYAGVDGDACDTRLCIPMAKLVEFFAAIGWTLSRPETDQPGATPPHATETDVPRRLAKSDAASSGASEAKP